MTLSIKNAEAERWAREIAELTGESVGEAVATALRERLARIRPPTADDLRAIARETASRWPKDQLDVDHGTLLYDEAGLPK